MIKPQELVIGQKIIYKDEEVEVDVLCKHYLVISYNDDRLQQIINYNDILAVLVDGVRVLCEVRNKVDG